MSKSPIGAPIGDAGDARRGRDRHLANQHQNRLLEQQGEAAAGARPGHVDAQDTMLGAVGARDAGGDDAGVLEEVQMPPARLFIVVRLAQAPASWARKPRAVLGLDREVQLVRLLVGLQALVDHVPRRGEPEAKGEDVAGRQGLSPC